MLHGVFIDEQSAAAQMRFPSKQTNIWAYIINMQTLITNIVRRVLRIELIYRIAAFVDDDK
jgi:hypothetical protein